jgi:predicted amidohydrolase
MADSKPSSFRVGMIQMRSGRNPQANTEAAAKLIGEAKERGAEYVLTPEMTNIMETGRERFFASIVPEEQDATLMTLRELARTFGIYVHVGSLAIKVSADKAVNRSFLIDRHGKVAARYDKIHMFDVDLASGESYRESRNYRPGELAVLADLPWGRLGLTTCAFRRSIARWRKPAPRS